MRNKDVQETALERATELGLESFNASKNCLWRWKSVGT